MQTNSEYCCTFHRRPLLKCTSRCIDVFRKIQRPSFLVPPPRPWQTMPRVWVNHRWLLLSPCPGATGKTRLRLPPPQPAVAKSWHCQEDGERREEDGVWPSLRVPRRNRLHLLIWAKSDSKQISLFPFILYCM